MSRTLRRITGVALGLLMTVATGAAEDKAKKLKYEELPPPVQITVDAQTSGMKVWGYTMEDSDGKALYRVNLYTHHRPRVITIAADGALVSVNDWIPWQSIPANVQDALLAGARPGSLGQFHSLTMNDKIVSYSALVDNKGDRRRISVSLEAAVLEAVPCAPEAEDEK